MLDLLAAPKTDKEWARLARWVLGLSAALHFLAAVFSVGHHSADEYFQILEFMSFKLGATPAADLAVEYGERMRPWLLPAFGTALVKGLGAVGISNPFHWAMALRLISGLIGWLSLVALVRVLPLWLAKPWHRWWALIFVGTLWYLPALHVRPSSESGGGSFALIALVALTLGHRALQKHEDGLKVFAWGAAVGAAFGAAFEFRFQMGLVEAGALCWLIWQIAQEKRRQGWWALGVGYLLARFFVFGLGRSIDWWGYGEWVMSPWNYFRYNLVRGEVNRYLPSPWWDVFRMSLTEAWPPLGLIVVVSWCVAWVRNPKHLLTWAYLPFFAVHCLITHKELRFFFPIASAGSVLLMLALQGWAPRIKIPRPAFVGRLAVALLILLGVDNALGLVAGSTQPMARAVGFYQDVWNQVGSEGALWTDGWDPYLVLGSHTYFYRPKNLRVEMDPMGARFSEFLRRPQRPVAWVAQTGLDLDARWKKADASCERVAQTIPAQALRLRSGEVLKHATIWSLFRCVSPRP